MKPDWLHRTLKLPIGETSFEFRTFSLYDVWCVWPHLAPMYQAILSGNEPLAFHEHALEVIRVVNPVLASDPEFFGKITPIQITILIEFYRKEHRWAAITDLGKRLEGGGRQSDTAPDAEDAKGRFFLICAAAARSVNKDLLDFVQQRFEFCVDTILELRRQADEATVQNWSDFHATLQATLGTVKIDPENKPEWMRAIESGELN